MGLNRRSIEDIRIDEFEECPIVYGAGKAGHLISFCCDNRVIFCDSNLKLVNENVSPPIMSVDACVQKYKNKKKYLVGFIGNILEKINSAVDRLLSLGINEDNIIVVEFSDSSIMSIQDNYWIKSINDIINCSIPVETVDEVKNIIFLSIGYDEISETQGSGGPPGVICMQKSMLGSKYRGITLRYPYIDREMEKKNALTRYGYHLDLITWVSKLAKNHENTIYISNDITTAAGLMLAGKNYIFIHHMQGDFVQEYKLWGRPLSQKEEIGFYKLEKAVFQNAYKAFFPSEGARYFFDKSVNHLIEYNYGGPLYNTITDFSRPEEMPGIEKKDGVITFLSIGQFTKLKGMDRIPGFLHEYCLRYNKNIRWIVVADGVLKESIHEEMDNYIRDNSNIEFVNIDYRISHSQVYYLMSISDVYLMLHRVSIFDYSTLEAMYYGLPVILSNIPGNIEYSKNDNIFLYDENSDWNQLNRYINNGVDNGEKNRATYDEFFDINILKRNYYDVIEDFIKGTSNKEIINDV